MLGGENSHDSNQLEPDIIGADNTFDPVTNTFNYESGIHSKFLHLQNIYRHFFHVTNRY